MKHYAIYYAFDIILDTFGFPVGARSVARRAVFWHQLPKMALFGVNNALFWSEIYCMLSYSMVLYSQVPQLTFNKWVGEPD